MINLDFYKGKDLYSDGDIENKILDIVKEYQDYEDILHNTEDWALLYHLSPLRQNILNWYDFKDKSNLLEIGGGCGALTGLFAEKLEEVKVVELSKRRSEIIFNRCKRYTNIEIIVGNFNDVTIKEKFDYVTLIGVLEYAAMFTSSDTPFSDFIKKAASYLKPNGKLLIAIENKFGLKYWAGAREDHTGRFFDSIENYPYNKSIQTFGKKELEDLIKACGFRSMFFYYPIPDYKLPKIIYSDNYLPEFKEAVDLSSNNYDQDRFVLFNENSVYKSIIHNDQFKIFANSFLIEAVL